MNLRVITMKLSSHKGYFQTACIKWQINNNQVIHKLTKYIVQCWKKVCCAKPFVFVWCIWNQRSNSCDMHRCTEQCHELEILQTATDSALAGLGLQTSDNLLQTSTSDEHWKHINAT